jgi:methyl-accepting chemotaxis protein
MLIFSVLAAALILLVWALSLSLFENTKIGSKLYDEIMLSNELTTDIKPPVEYVIEAYAAAQEYIGTDGSDQRDELYTSFQTLKQAFLDRYKYWDAHITDNEMRQVFLKDSYDSAIRFFDVFENEVVTAGKNYNAVQMKSAQRNLKAVYL